MVFNIVSKREREVKKGNNSKYMNLKRKKLTGLPSFFASIVHKTYDDSKIQKKNHYVKKIFIFPNNYNYYYLKS